MVAVVVVAVVVVAVVARATIIAMVAAGAANPVVLKKETVQIVRKSG